MESRFHFNAMQAFKISVSSRYCKCKCCISRKRKIVSVFRVNIIWTIFLNGTHNRCAGRRLIASGAPIIYRRTVTRTAAQAHLEQTTPYISPCVRNYVICHSTLLFFLLRSEKWLEFNCSSSTDVISRLKKCLSLFSLLCDQFT